MNPGSSSNAMGNRQVLRAISYALVFLMMACVVLTMSSLIRNALPGWHSGVIAGVTLLIVIDRLYTYQQLKSLTPFSFEWLMGLGTQWIVIVLFIRVLLSYANGFDSFLTDMSLFARGYLASLFTPEFVVTLLLALLAWYLSGQFLELLHEISPDQAPALHEAQGPVPSETLPAHQRLVNLIFSMGIVLVILAALTRINLRAAFSGAAGIPPLALNRLSGGEAGALLYFLFGLGLLSLGRLMSLQSHWRQQRIPVSSNNLAGHWGIYSLFFLLILTVVVSVLPAGDSLGFFSLLGTLIVFLISILFFIVQLLAILIILLFSLPFQLLGKAVPFVNRLPPLPPLPTAPVESALPMDGSALWALLRSILLWGSLLVILVFSFIRFVRQHDGILAALRKSRVTNWLILAWQWLRRNADETRGSLSHAIADGWRSIVARLAGERFPPRPAWINFRSLDPRRRIFFFYLAMIRRGGEQGLTRKSSQTPSEYAVRLEKALPSAREDIDSITDAFVKARYSRHAVSSRAADLVKTTWGRIQRALRSKSKRGE